MPVAPDRPRRAPHWARKATVLMSQQGLGRSDLAAAMGISLRALADRLAGRTRPFTGELAAVASVLGVGVAELLESEADRGAGRLSPDLALLTERDRATYRASDRVAPGPSLRTVAATRAYIDETLASPWWVQWCPEVGEVVVDGCGSSPRAYPAWHSSELVDGVYRHTVHLPRWSRRPLIVLHELAHVAGEALLSARAHGPQFARLWVDLVAERMGAEPASRLAAELRAEGLGLAARPEVARARRQGLAELDRLLGAGVGGRRVG